MVRWAVIAALAATGLGCSSATAPTQPRATLVLSGATTLTGLNQRATLTATLGGVDVTQKAAWATSLPSVATVGADPGTVTAIGNGTATILASYDGQTAAATIQVSLTDPTLRLLTLVNPLPSASLFSYYFTSLCGPASTGMCDLTGIVTGGRAPYTFELGPGSALPNGIRFGAGLNLGIINGQSNAAGTWPITVCAVDAVENRACLPTRLTVVDDFSGTWAGMIVAPPIAGREADCPGGTWHWSAKFQVQTGGSGTGAPPIAVTWTDDIPHHWRSGPAQSMASIYSNTNAFYFSPADGLQVYGYVFGNDRTIGSGAWAHPECRPGGAFLADKNYKGTWTGGRIGP